MTNSATPGYSDNEQVNQLVGELMGRIGDKWTMLVLEALDENGESRFGALARLVPGISQKMLTRTLRLMERDGLVTRTVHPVVPPHVDYRLTPLGESLGEALCGLWIWAEAHVGAVEAARAHYETRGDTRA